VPLIFSATGTYRELYVMFSLLPQKLLHASCFGGYTKPDISKQNVAGFRAAASGRVGGRMWAAPFCFSLERLISRDINLPRDINLRTREYRNFNAHPTHSVSHALF